MQTKIKLVIIVVGALIATFLLVKKLNTCFISNCTTFNNSVLETNINDSDYYTIEFISSGGLSVYQKLETTINSSGLIIIETTQNDGTMTVKKSQLDQAVVEKYEMLAKEVLEDNIETNYSCSPKNNDQRECAWLDIPTRQLIINTQNNTKEITIEGLPELPNSVQTLLDRINDTTIIVVS